MEGCLLCLEVKKEFVDGIFMNSNKWHTLNIKDVLDKHLWPMNHIEDTSWICTSCWGELYDFHTFYIRIEEAHKYFRLFGKNVTAEEKSGNAANAISECSVSESGENAVDELEENPVDELKDLLNVYNLSDNHLQSNLFNEEQKPTAKHELYKEPLTDSNILVQKRKRGRPRKDVCNGTSTTKAALKNTKKYKQRKIKDTYSKINESLANTKKIKQNKCSEMPVKDIEIIKENATNILNNVEIKPQSNFLPTVSEEPELSLDNYSDSNETDRESIDHIETKSSMKINCPQKINHNEKDKFLAKNFKISCFLCNKPFETFFSMLKHFEVIHRTERGHVKCCNKKFYRRSILVDHVHYHLNPNYFKCSQCGKVMADRRCLELHIETHESNHEKNHCCDICGKGFAKLAVLKKHRMIHLSDEEKRFSCSDCVKNFASKYLLSSHYRTVHLKKYTKICDICGKSIRCKDVFERHMLQHEGKTAPSVSCDVCGLILTDKKALKRHKDIIHPIGGQHEYTCSICSKTSPNLRAHKRHVQYKHVMGYDHKCTICDKAFKRAPTLKEHMASHTGTILYTCPWCPKTFNSNANMHNHRKKVHPKEWEEASRKRYSGNLPPNYKPPITTDSSEFTVPLDT